MPQWEPPWVTSGTGPREADEPPGETARSVVDQLPAIFLTTDHRLRFTSSLGTGMARLGLGPNQLVGTSLFEFFETRDRRFPAIEAHHEALAGRTVAFDLTWGGLTIRARVAPLRDSRGRAIGTICIALDMPDDEPDEGGSHPVRGSMVG